ncbi:MAG TPA: Hsp20/alpha crystallin family protein, partial [Metabacillus sp.]|nr:Hsp20/alpha crystallin family protein [Metabacillus sp.]
MKMINDFFQSRPKRTLLDSIDQVFEKSTSVAGFSLEVKETADHFIIVAELPGVSKEDINVELRGDEVLISVKEQQNQCRKIGGIRSVGLPHYVVRSNMKATYHHGLLEVRLEKKKPKRIEIE